MALIQNSLIWVAYAVCLGVLALIAAVFVFIYQKPSERSIVVTAICWLTTLSLLATVLLLPVDVALTSATVDRKLGRKKEWATPDRVDDIKLELQIVYYLLYSLDAVLCLLVVPFAYFWHEEYDQVDSEEGTQTVGSRLWGAFKYTLGFLALVVVLFLVGFFIPVAKKARDENKNLDYFKYLLTENRKPDLLMPWSQRELTECRWRARPDLLRWCSHPCRHSPVLSLHCAWTRSPSRHPHQVSPSHFRSADGSFNIEPTRTEP